MTTTSTLDPLFADAIRTELLAIGTRASGLQRRQRRTRVLAVGIAVVAAAGATTGAAIVANLPGTTTVTPTGNAVTVTETGTATIDLGAATSEDDSVIMDISCLSAGGTISVPLNPGVYQDAAGNVIPDNGANTLKIDCAASSSTVHITDGYLPTGASTITVTASAGTSWTAVAQYGTSAVSDWGVNANGQSYGVPNDVNGQPDLQAAQATNGAIGYIATKELLAFRGVGYLDVYESDGTTVIGQFPIGYFDENGQLVSDPPVDPHTMTIRG